MLHTTYHTRSEEGGTGTRLPGGSSAQPQRAPTGDAPALWTLPGGARRGDHDGRHRQRAPRRGRRIVRRPSEGSAACGRGWAPAHSPQGNTTSRQLAPAGRLEGEPGFCTNGQRVCRLRMQRSTNKQPDAKAQAPFRGRLSFPAVERMGIRATDQTGTRTILAGYSQPALPAVERRRVGAAEHTVKVAIFPLRAVACSTSGYARVLLGHSRVL